MRQSDQYNTDIKEIIPVQPSLPNPPYKISETLMKS